MKIILPIFSLVFLIIKHETLYAQQSDTKATHMFRIYEDNDFLNISGNGTDNSYTNGLRLDLFYTNKKKSGFFIDHVIPKAGKNSINVFGWSLTQLMFTPNDISTPIFQPNDYQYAGALFASYSLYSINTIKKYSFQTEFIAGIRGPASFAKEFQTFIHSMIHYTKPTGWGNQLSNYPLLNINFSVEKQLLNIGQFIEVIAGAQLNAGTYLDAIKVYPLIRIGRMAPYFNGYFSRHGSFYRGGRKFKTQFYLVAKPDNSFVLYNALLYGKRMNKDQYDPPKQEQMHQIEHQLRDIQFGAVIALGNFGLSYLQTNSKGFAQGLYHHNWGNISVFYSW